MRGFRPERSKAGGRGMRQFTTDLLVPNAGRVVRGLCLQRGSAGTKSRCAYVREEFSLATVLVKQLIEAGVHFGHRASKWNPKMRPYIYGRRNLIHIIDVRETVRGVIRARKYLSQVASQGGQILFVGTKKQAAETVEREASRCGMPYINDRWLGGALTNFRTIRSRLPRLEQ